MNIVKKIFKSVFCGGKHLNNNTSCQDYASYRISKDGFLAACLSDGAGGAKYAELASRTNVEAVLNYFQANKIKDFLTLTKSERTSAIIEQCQAYLNASAKKYNIFDIEQLSATLLILLITDEKIYIGHIGDGAAAAIKTNGSLSFLSEPENINGQKNRTYFTVEFDAKKHYKEKIYDSNDFSEIIIFSDGPYNDIKKTNNLSDEIYELLKGINNNSISNDISFSQKVGTMTAICDDWSMLAFSLSNGNTVVKNKNLEF